MQRSSGYSPFSGDVGASPSAQAGVGGASGGTSGPSAWGGNGSAPPAGTLLAVLEGHTRSVRALALAPDSGDVYTAGNDGCVLCWGAADLRLLGAWRSHAGSVLCLALPPAGAGLLYSGGDDGCVRGWDRGSPGAGDPLVTLRAPQSGSVQALKLQPAGPPGGPPPLLASAHNDGAVRLWRPAAGEACYALLLGHTGPVFGLQLSPDAQTLYSASHDATGRCWRLDAAPATATEPPTQLGAAFALRGHRNGLTEAMAVSSDGLSVYTAANDGDVRKWDAKTGAPVGPELRGHARSVLALALSDDGSALYSGSADGAVRAWRTADGSTVRVLSGHKGAVYALALSLGGGALFSGAYDDTVRGWATADGSCICLLRGHVNLVCALRLAPDGATLFSASADNTARAWRVPVMPPLPRLGRAYDAGAVPSREEEALASAMGQLGAFLPAAKAGSQSHSPADEFTLKPGRDGRAHVHMARTGAAESPSPPPPVQPPPPASPPLPALLQPLSSPPPAAAPASAKPPVSPAKAPSPPPPPAAAPASSPGAVTSRHPPAPAGLPAFAPPPAAGREASSDALLGGTLRPRSGASAASPEGRRSPLALRPTEGGATAFGSAGYAGAAAPSAYAPPSAESYVPSPGAAQYSSSPTKSASADFAARAAAARALGGTFVPIVMTAGAANATGFTAADSPRAPAATDAAAGEVVVQPGGAGDASRDAKAVADGNGCSEGDFSARIFRARSSGALSDRGSTGDLSAAN